MTMNVDLWGPNPPQKQLEILNTFNTPGKLQGAFKMGQDACLAVLTGIVNHMAPGGDFSAFVTFCFQNLTILCRTAHARTEFRLSVEPARWKEAHATELFQQVTIIWHCLIGCGLGWQAAQLLFFFPALA